MQWRATEMARFRNAPRVAIRANVDNCDASLDEPNATMIPIPGHKRNAA
jgi:hypothetical protein